MLGTIAYLASNVQQFTGHFILGNFAGLQVVADSS